MKPPAFSYHRPASVSEALQMLAEFGPDAKVLAGGQSLVPLLNMRLAAPAHLVDINGLSELSSIRCDADEVCVGALARHAHTERDERAFATNPLLRQATGHVAHPTIRNRGTTVGSLVHADPAAELPAVLLLCDGSVDLASTSGRRQVAAADFFLGPLESALRPGELAVQARFAALPASSGTSFLEVSRRSGDYALCGVAVTVTLDGGVVAAARAAYISVAPTPLLVDLAEAVGGAEPDAADWTAAGALAAARVRPEEDIHASSDYRRHLVAVLTERAGRAAAAAALAAVATHPPSASVQQLLLSPPPDTTTDEHLRGSWEEG
jgi:aerobic carbon-monoxide dehydrogenase medium subunit